MSRRNLTQATSGPVVYYAQPAAQQQVVVFNPAELAAQQRRDAVLVAQWRARNAAIAERDRRVRKRLLIAAAVTLPTLLSCGGVLGWLTYQALSGAAAGAGKALAAVLVAAVLLAALAAGGHRCVTVVKHWH